MPALGQTDSQGYAWNGSAWVDPKTGFVKGDTSTSNGSSFISDLRKRMTRNPVGEYLGMALDPVGTGIDTMVGLGRDAANVLRYGRPYAPTSSPASSNTPGFLRGATGLQRAIQAGALGRMAGDVMPGRPDRGMGIVPQRGVTPAGVLYPGTPYEGATLIPTRPGQSPPLFNRYRLPNGKEVSRFEIDEYQRAHAAPRSGASDADFIAMLERMTGK